jgi:hypothetical protein
MSMELVIFGLCTIAGLVIGRAITHTASRFFG